MATDIFLNRRGIVSAFATELGIPLNMFVQGWGGFQGFKSIITEMQVQQQEGVQFMHTLRDFIYVYVFGARISQMSIRGLSFWNPCGKMPGFHGLEYVNAYYLANRVSQTGAPVSIVFGGGTAFYGFLTHLVIDMNNPQDYIGQYSLDFHVIPEQSSVGQ